MKMKVTIGALSEVLCNNICFWELEVNCDCVKIIDESYFIFENIGKILPI